MPHLRAFTFVVMLLGVTQACGGAPPVNGPGAAVDQIPRALSSQIDERWPDYQIVNATPGECAGRRLASPSPVIAADLNGDRLGDFAVHIRSSDTTRVVAGLRRLNDDDEFDVRLVAEAPPDVSAQLDLAAQGTAFRSADVAVVEFFATDTLLLIRCGAGATGFFWSGSGFTPRAIDSSAPAASQQGS